MNRFNRYLATGEKPGEGKEVDTGNGKGKGKGKGKSDSWFETLRERQSGYPQLVEGQSKHKFEVSLG
jgi:hypothetical protein